MRLVIDLQMINDAFADAPGEEAGAILKGLGARLRGHSFDLNGDGGALRDRFGNTVGAWAVLPADPPRPVREAAERFRLSLARAGYPVPVNDL